MDSREFTKRLVRAYDERSHLFNSSRIETTGYMQVEHKPNCFVEISVVVNGETFLGRGFSKVCYPDKWDPDKGITIARNRALVELAQDIWMNADTHFIMWPNLYA